MTNEMDRPKSWDLDEWDQNVAEDVRAAIAGIERLNAENAEMKARLSLPTDKSGAPRRNFDD
jgi:hypothetical protein